MRLPVKVGVATAHAQPAPSDSVRPDRGSSPYTTHCCAHEIIIKEKVSNDWPGIM
jgi:hypothetical protein